MAKRKTFNKIDQARLCARISELRCQKWTETEMAAELGISQQQAGDFCRMVEEDSIRRMQKSRDVYIADSLETCDLLERYCWKVMRENEAILQAMTQAGAANSDGEQVKQRKISLSVIMAGLDRLLQISSRRSKLLGLDRPALITWADTAEQGTMTDEEKVALLHRIFSKGNPNSLEDYSAESLS